MRVLELGPGDLPAVCSLLKKYRDLPMDFADASLVHVAGHEKITEVFTLDRRDFSVYRLPRGRNFRLIPR